MAILGTIGTALLASGLAALVYWLFSRYTKFPSWAVMWITLFVLLVAWTAGPTLSIQIGG